MKSKVKLSFYSLAITVIVYAIFIVGIFFSLNNADKLIPLVIIFVGMVGTGLYYAPIAIEANDVSIKIKRVLKTKEIPYSEIYSFDRCVPSGGGLRLCGSGGFMGFWGYFNDIIIGNYFAYYGNTNQCILIKLNSGKQYVISCDKPNEMFLFLNNSLSQFK